MKKTGPPLLACCVAEVIGTFFLVFFGCGVVHTAVLIGAQSGLWQVAVVWAIAIALAIFAVGGVSGAHINPAMTIAFAVRGRFPWSRVVPYAVSQLAGAILAAACLFFLFQPYLAEKERQKHVTRGGPGSAITAMCYGEYYPNPGGAGDGPFDPSTQAQYDARVSEGAACLAEFLGTLILALVVFALIDPRNGAAPHSQMAPVFIGLTVGVLISVIAPLTQACFNPARDFGPRLFAYFAGWGEIAIPGPNGRGFLTVYILAPILGAVAGGSIYDTLLRPFHPGAFLEKVESDETDVKA
ncbi:MAG TPA: MIP/aquaporin family protein [Gemmataceae bacterium]|jgi:glycerol uptake facilitator protein|nr:MIP/aquaporin family protein [Gemmataceae bacterium]